MQKETILGKTWYTNDINHRNTHSTQIYLYKGKDRMYIAKFFALDNNSHNACNKDYEQAKNALFMR